MDAELDAPFARMETALNALIESITSYNPSLQAAIDLVQADDDLNRGLEKLAVHQSNYRRILALRRTADDLDAQLKSTLALLAETRKELIDTPATTLSRPAHQVTAQELLAYGRHIARFTVPPNYRPGEQRSQMMIGGQAQQATQEDVTMGNGDATAAEQAQQPESAEQENNKMMDMVPDEKKGPLASSDHLPFIPWPTEMAIHRGALAEIQRMVEQGKDPATVLSAEEAAERARQAAEAEEAELREEERREAEARERARQMASQGQGHRPDVFGQNIYDD
ncbi:hypothetical protein K490DRAFT_64599 [Saccharata proteae CBS 121410]|uniref:Mediator of RNA polymerase II transcription subunit 4 n=1 Tax=Saccharata proteae CBS 121410 TaxID=1314787 RepID=A0A9P4HZT1_9PEZI|nr:hypothetical protein K490DRAFT_64599 [Saccharata proteae CBS 121410]